MFLKLERIRQQHPEPARYRRARRIIESALGLYLELISSNLIDCPEDSLRSSGLVCVNLQSAELYSVAGSRCSEAIRAELLSWLAAVISP
ncbi:hypothetical protein EVAR_28254_1 [Eumeta japonica]|uniref:Uncharacterized protein n=1 Tax=Eumeta variegata TaxID=151549 RepID=A0A4C1V6H9_EUMVA|nr:hypothetical protein EVAR_28254_1 [Eumeta japonica]